MNRVGACAIAILLAACGRSNVTPPTPPPPTPTPPPPTLADLSATVSSPEADMRLACRDDVHARVSVTNRAQGAVTVTGIHKTSAVIRGGCREAPDNTYIPSTRIVPGRSTTVIMDRPLYTSGSGCCFDENNCRGNCDFQETFEVVTELGNVPAGRFQINVTFQNCLICSSSMATGLGQCPPRVSVP
jgi:hypothetical protein